MSTIEPIWPPFYQWHNLRFYFCCCYCFCFCAKQEEDEMKNGIVLRLKHPHKSIVHYPKQIDRYLYTILYLKYT